MTQDPLRHYVVLNVNAEVTREYFRQDPDGDLWATQYIAKNVYGREVDKPPFEVVARPSNDIHSAFEEEAPKPQQVVVALEVRGGGKVRNTDVVDDIIKAVSEKQDIFAGSSADIPFAGADHWCGEGGDPIFSDRSDAEQLLGIGYLRRQGKTSGKGVNVVVVDQGLDKHVLGASYGGGWSVGNSLPGSPPPHPGSVGRPHGMMIAHNILKVAPEAKLFDLPLAPPKIADIQKFLSSADAAYRTVLDDIKSWRTGAFPGPWILVNPWGIFDRSSEYPKGHYTQNPNNLFNQLVGSLEGGENRLVADHDADHIAVVPGQRDRRLDLTLIALLILVDPGAHRDLEAKFGGDRRHQFVTFRRGIPADSPRHGR